MRPVNFKLSFLTLLLLCLFISSCSGGGDDNTEVKGYKSGVDRGKELRDLEKSEMSQICTTFSNYQKSFMGVGTLCEANSIYNNLIPFFGESRNDLVNECLRDNANCISAINSGQASVDILIPDCPNFLFARQAPFFCDADVAKLENCLNDSSNLYYSQIRTYQCKDIGSKQISQQDYAINYYNVESCLDLFDECPEQNSVLGF